MKEKAKTPEERQKILAKIEEFKTQQNMTVEKAAEKAGITKSVYYRWLVSQNSQKDSSSLAPSSDPASPTKAKKTSTRRTDGEKKELIKKIQALSAEMSIEKACSQVGIQVSMYYAWRKTLISTKRPYTRRKPHTTTDLTVIQPQVRSVPHGSLEMFDNNNNEEQAIPVILTKLTPSQLAAFMGGK